MLKLLVAATTVAFASGAVAGAQTSTTTIIPLFESAYEIGARAGLMQTPVSGLPPITTSTIAGEVQKSVVFSLRGGYTTGSTDFSFNSGVISDTDFSLNSGAITATIPLSMGSTVSITAGGMGCNGCGGGGFMTGLAGDIRIREVPFQGTRLLFTARGNVGYGNSGGTVLSDGNVFGASFSVPISVLFSARNPKAYRFVPFFAPGIGYGSAQRIKVLRAVGPAGQVGLVTESGSGTRFVMDGGFAIYRRTSPWGLNFGAQYLYTNSSNVGIGLGLNYGGW